MIHAAEIKDGAIPPSTEMIAPAMTTAISTPRESPGITIAMRSPMATAGGMARSTGIRSWVGHRAALLIARVGCIPERRY